MGETKEMKLTFYYEGGNTYTTKVDDYDLTQNHVHYRCHEEKDGVSKLSILKVEKRDLLGLKVVSGKQTTLHKFKKKCTVVAGIIE